MNKIIVIVGPTGVGKTKLSIALAKHYNGEIINADSMQIYKGLNIGTAKVTEAEKDNIPHHLFDIKKVNEDYSIYHYQQDSRKVIDEIKKRHKTVIMVGGTGLYLKACLYNYTLESELIDDEEYPEYSNEELYQKLLILDPQIKIDYNNRKRVVRAINYFKQNQKSITTNTMGNELLYEIVTIGLTTNREKLYDLINTRVDLMIENGLVNEVKAFYDQNNRSKPLLSGIGYKELYQYFDGEISYNEAIELIKKNSRHYAKRQYTWFNHQMKVNWFNVDFDNFNNTINEITNYLDQLL